jgi:uncharacterized protein (TIGR01777 family)
MKVVMTGSTGLVGSALVRSLETAGHGVTRLLRPASRAQVGAADVGAWDPAAAHVDSAALEGRELVVHLAGDNIASGRWTAVKKARIRASRVEGTRVLCEAIAKLSQPPKTVICASAIGYYGDRGEEILDESSAPGEGFLASVCREWEAAAQPATECGCRVVLLRIGVILSPLGGALARMLLPFKLGAGGKIGNGKQYMSWISLDDIVEVVQHAMVTEDLRGPVNAVAPNPVTNLEFTKSLGRILSRPTLFSMPSPVARLAFGEMADAALLASTRVEPLKLKETGYKFRHPELAGALKHVLS